MAEVPEPTPAELRRCREAVAPNWEVTRRSLLTRLKDLGDDQSWQRFADTYSGVIRRLAWRAGCSDGEADEVLQETLISVAGEMPGFRYDPARGSFKAWLFCVVRRRIADQFRRRSRQQRTEGAVSEELESVPAAGEDPLSAHWDDEWRQHRLFRTIERVKQRVSPGQWQMFDLAVLQDCPTERICALLGVNRAQIYMAKMRVGRLLRQEHAAMVRAEAGDQVTP